MAGDFPTSADQLRQLIREELEVHDARKAETEAAARFLLDRLNEFASGLMDSDAAREYFGHVAPPAARLLASLSQEAA